MRNTLSPVFLFFASILCGICFALIWRYSTPPASPEIPAAHTPRPHRVPVPRAGAMPRSLNLMSEADIRRNSTLPLQSAINDTALAVRLAVKAGNYAEADKLMQEAFSKSKLTGLGFFTPFDDVVRDLHQTQALPIFIGVDKWVESDKDSPFPYIARAQNLIATAWAVRGNGFANETPAERMNTFETKEKQAMLDLVRSVRLDDKIPTSFELLLGVMRDLAVDEPTYNRAFKEATRKFPNSYPIFKERFRRLKPKWGGSIAQLMQFVNTTVEGVSQDSPLRLLVQDLYFGLIIDMKTDCMTSSQDAARLCEQAVEQLLRSKEMADEYRESARMLEKAYPVEFGKMMMNTYAHDSLIVSPYTRQALDWEKNVLGDGNYATNFGYARYFYNAMHSKEAAQPYLTKALAEIEDGSFTNPEDKQVALAKVYGEMANESFEEGDFQAAVGYDDRAIAQNNTVSDYFSGRCQAYFKLNKYAEALSDCHVALLLGAARDVFALQNEILVKTHSQLNCSGSVCSISVGR